MSDPSKSSFIPKRGPTVKQKRKGGSRRVYVFTIISYVLMFATLLATGGVYFYSGYVEKLRDKEIASLNSEISSFNKADMQKVMEFDFRLSQASNRLENAASLISIFHALEAATVNTAQIISFNLEREGDEKILLAVDIETDSFDSTIFQRGVYGRNQTLGSIDIFNAETSDRSSEDEDNKVRGDKIVTFNAEIEVPLSAVPYVPVVEPVTEDLTITDLVDEENSGPPVESRGSSIGTNEENI